MTEFTQDEEPATKLLIRLTALVKLSKNSKVMSKKRFRPGNANKP
jgi:hypothetical protein